MFTPILACCQQPFTLIIFPMTDVLNPLREQIDAIDEQLISLIKQRISVVEQVGKFKKATAPNLCPVRAGREASMIRNIAESFKGSSFSAATAAAIWRLIIGASTHAESKLVISVLYNEKEHDYFWMAREYFGPSVTIIKQPNVKRIISDVLEGKSTIGLLPNFLANDGEEWWASLVQASADSPKIFAHLPFVFTDEAAKRMPTALAIAKLVPESSGEDTSFYVLHTPHDVSRNRLQSSFAAANLTAQWHGVLTPHPDSRLHLIEIKGFIEPSHEQFKQFTDSLGSSLLQVTFLGAHAIPFTLASEK